MKTVLVVIPTLNEEANIERVARELYTGLPRDFKTIMVVADGGSTDNTVSIARSLKKTMGAIELFHNKNKVQSAAINVAVAEFGQDCDVLIRCDAHASYPKNYIADIVAALETHEADSIVVSLDSVGTGCFQRAVAWISDMPLGSGGSAHRGGRASGFVDHGHHAGFRLASFKAVGGYDGTFTHNEDAEYDCRARDRGAKIYLDSSIRVQYWPRRTAAALWAQYTAYGYGRSRTVTRHPSSLRLRQFAVPANLIVLVVCFLATPYSFKMLVWPGLYFVTLAFASVFVAVSRASFCGLLAGPAACIMHLAWAAGFLKGLFRHIFVQSNKLSHALGKV